MNTRVEDLNTWLFKSVSIAPLVVFRLTFGLVLLYSSIRTYEKGWIKELYIDPTYHFSFFSWLQPLDGDGMYMIFLFLGLTSIGIIFGFLYRISIVVHFLLFAYVELIDKTYYLNHYYLVSLVVFWMIWVPAHRWYSVDCVLFPNIRSETCTNWNILIFKFQLSIVYFFAGLAKVNPDWMLRAQPMATWLPGKYQLPIIGQFMNLREVACLFSWSGCAYDLTIWIFLWMKKTRFVAYLAVLVFHIMTGILFPRIGMFPYIMIVSTVIFFSASAHEKILSYIGGGLSLTGAEQRTIKKNKVISVILSVYLLIQLFLPMRYLQYPGNLFWHERGYRFSWRVMLMEKNGYTSFIVKDPIKDIQREADQSRFLTAFQKQQLRSQPDMMIQFAHFLGDRFKNLHGYEPEVYVKSRISLNARRSQVFTDETLDVYGHKDPMGHGWIVPLKD